MWECFFVMQRDNGRRTTLQISQVRTVKYLLLIVLLLSSPLLGIEKTSSRSYYWTQTDIERSEEQRINKPYQGFVSISFQIKWKDSLSVISSLRILFQPKFSRELGEVGRNKFEELAQFETKRKKETKRIYCNSHFVFFLSSCWFQHFPHCYNSFGPPFIVQMFKNIP